MASEHEKKLIEMQMHLRENQAYLADTFADVENWSKDIKTKEEQLKQSKESDEKNLPPVRTLATVKKKKKVKKDTKDDKEKTQGKIKAYDYRNWDKFDVDKALEDADKESASEYTTDEEWEQDQKKERAHWEKERGNMFFKNDCIDEAINCYTRAMDLDPTDVVYPANRAMCLIKQEKYAAAEMDCTLAIQLDKNYIKAYHRRGTARVKLQKYEDALKDFESVLKLEPNNKIAQEELNKVNRLIESKSLVFPINKTADQRSTKPLKRIEIIEINDDRDEKARANMEEINSKIKLNTKEEKLFEVATKDSATKAKAPIITEIKSVSEPESVKEEGVKDEEIIKPKVAPKIELEIKRIEPKVVTIPPVPANGYQFRKDWQLLGNNIDALTDYLKQIDPSLYGKIFLNGLESDMLSKIIIAYKNLIKNDKDFNLVPYLKCLTEVKRFQTQIMFLSSNDKNNIVELMELVKIIPNIDSNDIDHLNKAFEL